MILHAPKVLIGVAAASQSVPIAKAFADFGYLPVLAPCAEHAVDFTGRENFDLILTSADLDPGGRLLDDVGGTGPVRLFLGDAGATVPAQIHGVFPYDLLPREIVARARALLSLRAGPGADGVLRFGALHLDLTRREARWRGERRSFTPIQFRILTALVERQGAVISKTELQRLVWRSAEPDDGERIVAHIRRIRMRLEDNPSKPQFLLTVRGEGFQLSDRGEELPPANDELHDASNHRED